MGTSTCMSANVSVYAEARGVWGHAPPGKLGFDGVKPVTWGALVDFLKKCRPDLAEKIESHF